MLSVLLCGALLAPHGQSMVATHAFDPETALVRVVAAAPRSVVFRTGPAPAPRRVTGVAVPQEPFEYSDGYATRAAIHRWASFATAPLFVLQYLAGEDLIEGEGGALADMHGGLAAGVAGLFVVNTLTGGLNLQEARHDPESRTLRTVHGLLMLAADAGFVATGVSANSADHDAHRSIAIGSMGVALVSYALMLPTLLSD